MVGRGEGSRYLLSMKPQARDVASYLLRDGRYTHSYLHLYPIYLLDRECIGYACLGTISQYKGGEAAERHPAVGRKDETGQYCRQFEW
jgi:hypothetical protein